MVSMASGPERPDAPDAMDLGLGIRVVRFPGEQCGHHGGCRRELTTSGLPMLRRLVRIG
jgi:hypothetical protein